MDSRLSDIFAECQRHSAVHKSSVKKLSSILKEMSLTDKTKSMELIMRGIVDQCLLVSKKEAAVERVIKFFCDFVAASCSNFADESVFRCSVEHLLKRSLASDKNVRYRACQCLSFIITSVNGDATISDDLWESVTSTLQPRLRDKAPNVRMWAIKALQRLQNGESKNDPILEDFIRLMSSDVAAAVRVAAVDNILLCKQSLTALVARVQDIKPEVRIAALERLTSSVDVRHLSSSQRATIATFGLNDRDSGCRNVAVGLVQKWATTLENKIPKLLQLINMTTNEAAVELVALTLIDVVENASGNPYPASAALKTAVREDRPQWNADIASIPGGEILWAQLRCDYARKHFAPSVAESVIDYLVPDMVELCVLLENAHCKQEALETKPAMQLSVRNLLRMTSYIDAADFSGAKELARVCEQMLVDVRFPDSLVDIVLDAWLRGLGKADNDTIMKNITALSEKFSSMEDSGLDEDMLQILSATRGLQLVSWALLQGISGADRNTRLSSTFYQFAVDSLQSTSPQMRRLAVKCLGLMGLSSENMCGSNREILFHVAAQDLEEGYVREQAVKSLVDIATVHPTLFKDHPVLTGLLLRIQEDLQGHFTTAALHRVAAEGSAKLLFQGTLNEPKLFSHVLRHFFVPELLNALLDSQSGASDDADVGSTVHSHRLQQLFSVFFDSYFATGSAGQQVAWESLDHLVGNLVVLCRDEVASVSALSRLCNHLLSMCGQAPTSSASSPTTTCCAYLAAAISREALKLGNSKQEKSIAKELVKVLISLSPKTWLTPQMAATMFKTGRCIARNCALDVATRNGLDKFIRACAGIAKEAQKASADAEASGCGDDEEGEGGDVLNDSQAYILYEAEERRKQEVDVFYSFAPGLADLVELIANDDDGDFESMEQAEKPNLDEEDEDCEEQEEEEESSPMAEPEAVAEAPKATKRSTAKKAESEAVVEAPKAAKRSTAKTAAPKTAKPKAKAAAVIDEAEVAVETAKEKEKKEKEKEPAGKAPPKSKSSAKSASAPSARSKKAPAAAAADPEAEEEGNVVAARSRRSRVVKKYAEDEAESDLEDGENHNPQEV